MAALQRYGGTNVLVLRMYASSAVFRNYSGGGGGGGGWGGTELPGSKGGILHMACQNSSGQDYSTPHPTSVHTYVICV